MAKYEKRAFTDLTINLDDNEFRDCRFVRCKMVYSGGVAPVMVNCQFDNCPSEFAGAAARTIVFMTDLYRSGVRTVVDNIIEGIRGEPHKGPSN